MKLSDFDYHLPDALIARYPMEERTASRLLVLDGASGEVEHREFPDMLDYLHAGDLLVFNDTRVLAARLWMLPVVRSTGPIWAVTGFTLT